MALARRCSSAFHIHDPSETGEARRAAVALVRDAGFSEGRASNVAIVVTEAANNVLRHAKGGQIVLTVTDRHGVAGIEILALDRGPGMANPGRCLEDGFSTAGTPGTGLGAMKRLSDRFEIHSVEGLGTAILAELWASPASSLPAETGPAIGGVCVPMRGEQECGDAWTIVGFPNLMRVLVADGLGHGPSAAEASKEAVRVFEAHPSLAPLESMEAIHGALRKTRGAAAAIADLGLDSGRIAFVGVGNIAGVFLSNGPRQGMASVNGTAGLEIRRLQEHGYSCAGHGALILHSDGITSRWNLDEPVYRGVLNRHPSLIAGILYRDFSRGRDDSTVVVVKK